MIPERSREVPIDHFTIPGRLANVLGANGFRVYGNMHGVRYDDFAEFRNCGIRTVNDLRALVSQIQSEEPEPQPQPPPPVLEPVDAEPVEDVVIHVPERARKLSPLDLPMSVRLENALFKRGVSCLGDLEGVHEQELRRLGNCGRATTGELKRLLEEAANAEFDLNAEELAAWRPCHLLAQLDTVLESLTPRDRVIVSRRLGGEPEAKQTLKALGTVFEITRERVRQVVASSLRRMVRTGRPRLKTHLRQLSSHLSHLGNPLSPALVESWRAQAPAPLKNSSALYVRLLNELSSERMSPAAAWGPMANQAHSPDGTELRDLHFGHQRHPAS